MAGLNAKVTTVCCFLMILFPSLSGAVQASRPLIGYVVYFDSIVNRQEGVQLVRFAADNGAQVISIVPPAGFGRMFCIEYSRRRGKGGDLLETCYFHQLHRCLLSVRYVQKARQLTL